MARSVGETDLRLLSVLRRQYGMGIARDDLASRLGLSSSTVLSAVARLRRAGYKIDSSRFEGYVLVAELPAEEIDE